MNSLKLQLKIRKVKNQRDGTEPYFSDSTNDGGPETSIDREIGIETGIGLGSGLSWSGWVWGRVGMLRESELEDDDIVTPLAASISRRSPNKLSSSWFHFSSVPQLDKDFLYCQHNYQPITLRTQAASTDYLLDEG